MTWRTGLAALLLSALHGMAGAQPVAMPEAIASFGPTDAADRLRLRSTTDIALFAPVLNAFLAEVPDVAVDYEQWGSNALSQASTADCRSGRGMVDLSISSAMDQQMKLANDGCAAAHRSAATERLPASANWRDEVFGISREPAVIVYNRTVLDRSEAPKSRFDLIDLLRPADSRFEGRVATYDIEASGLGYLFAFADAQQATTFGSLIESFGRADAVTACCSSTLIDGVASGDMLLAYNVLGSYALARAAENPDIAIVAPDDYTLILSRAALIPRSAPNPELARRMLDFLLSDTGRAALRAAHLIVDLEPDDEALLQLPANTETSLRPIPLTPALLVGLDQHKRARFVDRWRANFGRR